MPSLKFLTKPFFTEGFKNAGKNALKGLSGSKVFGPATKTISKIPGGTKVVGGLAAATWVGGKVVGGVASLGKKGLDMGLDLLKAGGKALMFVADLAFKAIGYLLSTLMALVTSGIRMAYGFMQSNLMGRG